MNDTTLETTVAAGGETAVEDRPRDARAVVHPAFRRQERFWKEIRKRIETNNPGARRGDERPY